MAGRREGGGGGGRTEGDRERGREGVNKRRWEEAWNEMKEKGRGIFGGKVREGREKGRQIESEKQKEKEGAGEEGEEGKEG